MTKQIIYHGTNCKVEIPRIITGQYYKDFGEGFYCTILKSQAKKWAKKFNNPIINIYEYNQNNKLKIKKFNMMTEEWLDFIVDCRSGKSHSYDIVIGPMADENIYSHITDYINGQISRESFWKLIKYGCPTHQIVFCTTEALNCTKFIDYKEII